MNKVEKIRQLLNKGKTTREIAKELKVSLRDIHRVRKQEGIDIGALERESERLNIEILQKKKEISLLEQQSVRLKKENQRLETEIAEKKAEVLRIPMRLEPVYLPENKADIENYLGTLDKNQLEWLWQRIYQLRLRQTAEAIEKQTLSTIRTEDIVEEARKMMQQAFEPLGQDLKALKEGLTSLGYKEKTD